VLFYRYGDWMRGDYYVVGGSGRVITSHATSIRTALSKRGVVLRVSDDDTLSGALQVPSLYLPCTFPVPSLYDDTLSGALQAAEGADVVVACGGATSSEAVDRENLELDQQQFLVGGSHFPPTLHP